MDRTFNRAAAARWPAGCRRAACTTSATALALSSVIAEAGSTAACALGQQTDSLVPQEFVGAAAVRRIGHRERRHVPASSPRRSPGLHGSWQDRQALRCAEERLGELGGTGKDMLAVVEQQERPGAGAVDRPATRRATVPAPAGCRGLTRRSEPPPQVRRSARGRPARHRQETGRARGARTSSPSRVLPQPPAPVSVSSRVDGRSCATSAISRRRPMKLLTGEGRLWCSSSPRPAAAREASRMKPRRATVFSKCRS